MKFTTKDGRVWYLHNKRVVFGRSGPRINYYFKRELEPIYACHIPDGYQVMETKTGMPVLRRTPLA